MPTLTVFFIRNGETIDEAPPTPNVPIRLHQRMDPSLTLRGYQQSKDVFTSLFQEICDKTPIPADRCDSDNDGVIDPLRNMACFAAPLKSCQGTAMLMSAAGLAKQDKLTWRYTTVEAAQPPTAVPIITCNGLCHHVPEIIKCGGVQSVIQAGLLHTAAEKWNNDEKLKTPIMKVITKEYKEIAQEFVREWKDDRKAYPPNKVLDVQYLRIENNDDPWSLINMTTKINITVDLLEPNMYLTPPRKGNVDLKLSNVQAKLQELDQLTPITTIKDCIWKARQIGCDTCFFTVPSSVFHCVLDDAGSNSNNTKIGPCHIISLLADVDDTVGPDSIDMTLSTQRVPDFPGPVDCIVPPPSPEQDPSTVPANQWSRFPPPPPENIPDDYPDLPPFGNALNEPVPGTNESPDGEEMDAPASPQRGPPNQYRGGPGRAGRGGGRAPGSPQRAPAGRAGRGRGGRPPQ